MTIISDFPTKLYVGVQSGAEFSTTDYPLSFATPFGADAAFRKRKETVDNWCGTRKYNYQTREYEDIAPGYEPKVIDNNPIEGFQLERVVSRYSTDNKMYRINDPRGFTVEITTENLCDIILNCVVDHGQLVGKFIWGRSVGKNYLTRLDHPEYQDTLEEKIQRSLQVGDIIRMGSDKSSYLYIGRYFFCTVDAVSRYRRVADGELMEAGFNPPYHNGYNYNRISGRNETIPSPFEHVYLTAYEKDEKNFQVFKRIDGYNESQLYIFRSVSKIDIVSENNAFEELALGEFDRYNVSGWRSSNVRAPLATKVELNNFNPDPNRAAEIYNKLNFSKHTFVGHLSEPVLARAVEI